MNGPNWRARKTGEVILGEVRAGLGEMGLGELGLGEFNLGDCGRYESKVEYSLPGR